MLIVSYVLHNRIVQSVGCKFGMSCQYLLHLSVKLKPNELASPHFSTETDANQQSGCIRVRYILSRPPANSVKNPRK